MNGNQRSGDCQHLYRINSVDCEQFFVGKAGARLVLMGLLFPRLVALFFDQAGDLVEIQARDLPQGLRMQRFNPDAPEWRASLLSCLRKWQREMDFAPSDILIKRFSTEDARIEDIPRYLVGFLSDPVKCEPDEVERRRTQESLDEWRRERRYVLFWGKDYWMNGDGTVYST